MFQVCVYIKKLKQKLLFIYKKYTGNPFRNQGFQSLASLISVNKTLKKLKIDGMSLKFKKILKIKIKLFDE